VSAVAWSSLGTGTENYPNGIIITGNKNGKISFFSPDQIIANYEKNKNTNISNIGLLGSKEIETDSINCLSVNKFKPNLIVSGGSSLLLHNFDKSFENCDSFTPALNMSNLERINSVSWNCKIAHIFAAGSDSGNATIWDVKNKKLVMTLTDPNFGMESFSSEGEKYFFILLARIL